MVTLSPGAGPGALRMLVTHLLATTDAQRLEAGVDLDNVTAQRTLRQAGFEFEGVLRGADRMVFGLLRTDVAPVERRVLALGDAVALAESLPAERERFYAGGNGDFEPDLDDRPRLTGPSRGTVVSILDAETGELLGGLAWRPVDHGGTVGCTAWNIGIGLLPEARGRGVGTAAQRLVADHLFATTGVDRVEASTAVGNVAEQKALEKAGFRREGVLRGAQLRGGERHGLVHYSRLRTDQ